MATSTMPLNESFSADLDSNDPNVRVSVQTYLSSMYHPDRDFLDGQLLERNVGENPHSRLQRFFVLAFAKHDAEWNLEVLPEQRVQVGSSRFRVADICVITVGEADDDLIVSRPPVLCIEVLSREDHMSEMQERVDDYLKMGVSTVWLVDPWRRKAFTIDSSGDIEPAHDQLTLAGTPVVISVQEMFHELDRLASKTAKVAPADK